MIEIIPQLYLEKAKANQSNLFCAVINSSQQMLKSVIKCLTYMKELIEFITNLNSLCTFINLSNYH